MMNPALLRNFYFKKETPEELPGVILDALLAEGWFRMRQTIFASSHSLDMEQYKLFKVWWLRYEVDQIRLRRSHREICKSNNAFSISIDPYTSVSEDEEELFSRYRSHLCFETCESLYNGLFEDDDNSIYDSQAIRIYDDGRLIALGIFDIGNDSAASILHCYDPAYKKFSLGKYLMLLTVNHLRTQGFHYYYPGYLMAGNPRFDYKLFLGKELACYYDSITKCWLPFQEKLLEPIEYTEEEVIDFFILK